MLDIAVKYGQVGSRFVFIVRACQRAKSAKLVNLGRAQQLHTLLGKRQKQVLSQRYPICP